MPKIVWDATGERFYETGISHGVLYIKDVTNNKFQPGVPWNGLTGVTESPSGADLTDLYADDIKYASLRSAELFGATIEAYTYPDEFAKCDGSAEPVPGLRFGQQKREVFGFCYRTVVGNDTDPEGGYKLHLIYNCTASPSEKAYATINDSPDAITFSWELATTPIPVEGYKPVSCLTIDSSKVNETKLKALEDILYGGETEEAKMPLPDEVLQLLQA